MTQKERLVELLAKYDEWQIGVRSEVDYYYEQTADYLLANGVIVPPCKVGDTVYIVPKGNVILDETVVSIEEINDKIILVNCTNEWVLDAGWFGTNVFLTREEAEQALKEGDKE